MNPDDLLERAAHRTAQAVAHRERVEVECERLRESNSELTRDFNALLVDLAKAEGDLRRLRLAASVAVEDVLLIDSPEGDSPRNIASNLRRALVSEEETTAASDGTDSGTPDDGSAERLSRPATSSSESSVPSGEQTREQLLERLALTVKEAVWGGSLDGSLFEYQVNGMLWMLYGERPARCPRCGNPTHVPGAWVPAEVRVAAGQLVGPQGFWCDGVERKACGCVGACIHDRYEERT